MESCYASNRYSCKIKDFAIDKEAFMLGALLHDLGKGITTKKNNQGRWTSYNHDVEGVKIAEKILNYYKYDDYEKEKILNLVRFHMHHLYIIKNLPYAKTKEMIKETNLNDIILLFISDRMGRGNFEKHKKEDEINDIKKVISILENNYILNLKDIKENVKKIEKLYKNLSYIYSIMNILKITIILLGYNNVGVVLVGDYK